MSSHSDRGSSVVPIARHCHAVRRPAGGCDSNRLQHSFHNAVTHSWATVHLSAAPGMGPHHPSSEASGGTATATASLDVSTAPADGGGGDWLASYLVSARFADDPRLSSTGNLRAIAALNATARKLPVTSNARVGDERVFANQQPDGVEKKQEAAARNAVLGVETTVDGGKAGALLQPEGSPEDFEAWMSQSGRGGRRGGKPSRRRKHRASVGAQPGDAIGKKAEAEARAATETSRKSREGKGEDGSHGAHPTGRASVSGRVSGRVSMSGRRTSIDYSDLEAIRERCVLRPMNLTCCIVV